MIRHMQRPPKINKVALTGDCACSLVQKIRGQTGVQLMRAAMLLEAHTALLPQAVIKGLDQLPDNLVQRLRNMTTEP